MAPSGLVLASCPRLTPLRDDTFAATTEKLVEVASQYYQCRCAAGITDELCKQPAARAPP